MDRTLDRIVKETVEEAQDYGDRVNTLMDEIENKLENIRTIIDNNKKLLFATWLYKVKRRQDQRSIAATQSRISMYHEGKSYKLPILCLISIAICLICILPSLAKSMISELQ